MRKATILLGVLACAAAVAFAALPDGERAIDRLSDVLRSMQDVTTDVAVVAGTKQATGTITLQYAKEQRGGEEKTVRKYVVETRRATPDGTVREKQVNDGKYLWVERTLVETGEVKVTRRRVDPEGPVPGGFGPDWRKEMDSWRQKYTFKTLREDTFDAEKVVVVEGVRKPADAAAPPSAAEIDITTPDRIVLFIAQRDDFPRKIDLYLKGSVKKPDGTSAVREVLACSVRFTHLKLNAGMKPGTFDYTLPAGAEFTDVK